MRRVEAAFMRKVEFRGLTNCRLELTTKVDSSLNPEIANKNNPPAETLGIWHWRLQPE
jgi:hypothetical protein